MYVKLIREMLSGKGVRMPGKSNRFPVSNMDPQKDKNPNDQSMSPDCVSVLGLETLSTSDQCNGFFYVSSRCIHFREPMLRQSTCRHVIVTLSYVSSFCLRSCVYWLFVYKL